MGVFFSKMWPSMGCLSWTVTSFSFSLYLFLAFLQYMYNSTALDRGFHSCRTLLFLFFFLHLYLKLPPNVGVQKSELVSAATGKVLDIGTRHSPRVLRSFTTPPSSLLLSPPCVPYIGLFYVTLTPNSSSNITNYDKKVVSSYHYW